MRLALALSLVFTGGLLWFYRATGPLSLYDILVALAFGLAMGLGIGLLWAIFFSRGE